MKKNFPHVSDAQDYLFCVKMECVQTVFMIKKGKRENSHRRKMRKMRNIWCFFQK